MAVYSRLCLVSYYGAVAVELALFGLALKLSSCAKVRFSPNDTADIVFAFSVFKKRRAAAPKLKKQMSFLSVDPISSAHAREKLLQTGLRNSLRVETLSSLLMTLVNDVNHYRAVDL